MSWIIRLFLILLLAGGVVWSVTQHPMPVHIRAGGFALDMPLWYAVAAFIFLMGLFWLAAKLIVGVLRLPRNLVEVRNRIRRNQGLQAAGEAVAHFAANRLERAASAAARARRQLDDPKPMLAFEGWMALSGGDLRAALVFFNALRRIDPDDPAAWRGLVEVSLRKNDRVTALAQAREALTAHPNNPWLLEASFRLQAGQGQWETAARTLDQLERFGQLDRRRRALTQYMLGLAKQEKQRHADARQYFRQALKNDPANPHAYLALGNSTALLGKPEKAVELWREGFVKSGSAVLLSRLAEQFADSPLKRVSLFEELAMERPGSAALDLHLARACLDARMWGVARDLFARQSAESLANPVHRRHIRLLQAEMALMEGEARKDPDGRAQTLVTATGFLRQALFPVDAKGWRCRACGAESDAFAPLCDQCGAWDRVYELGVGMLPAGPTSG